MEIVDILKAYFGYEKFRGKQEEIINSIINKKGVLAIMATGGGKSICFQIPGLYFEGLTIVISPLISLIVDQVRELKQKHISAAFLIGDMTSLAIREVYQLIMKKQLKFLYLSPERLVNQEFLKIISSSLVSQVVVDEAHCISMWGKDFRKSYQEIPRFLANLNSNPIVSAFTATANDMVIKDICKYLQSDLEIIKTTSDRDNLYFGIVKPKNKFDTLLKILLKHPNEKKIIYVLTRKKTLELSEKLSALGFKTTYFHGGLENELKVKNQRQFIKGDALIIVATNAFGMGINISDIRQVILYELPLSIEDLSQQFGRASRDGLSGNCYLFFHKEDLKVAKLLVGKDKEKIGLLKNVLKFIDTEKCLHQYLVDYFDKTKIAICQNCSNCNRHKKRKMA